MNMSCEYSSDEDAECAILGITYFQYSENRRKKVREMHYVAQQNLDRMKRGAETFEELLEKYDEQPVEAKTPTPSSACSSLVASQLTVSNTSPTFVNQSSSHREFWRKEKEKMLMSSEKGYLLPTYSSSIKSAEKKNRETDCSTSLLLTPTAHPPIDMLSSPTHTVADPFQNNSPIRQLNFDDMPIDIYLNEDRSNESFEYEPPPIDMDYDINQREDEEADHSDIDNIHTAVEFHSMSNVADISNGDVTKQNDKLTGDNSKKQSDIGQQKKLRRTTNVKRKTYLPYIAHYSPIAHRTRRALRARMAPSTSTPRRDKSDTRHHYKLRRITGKQNPNPTISRQSTLPNIASTSNPTVKVTAKGIAPQTAGTSSTVTVGRRTMATRIQPPREKKKLNVLSVTQCFRR